MRYIAGIVLAAALLTGCQNEEAAAPPSATPVSSAESSVEEPFLYIEQLNVIGGSGQLVQVKSNSDINQASLEQALKNSLQTSDPQIEFRYTLEWESPRFVQIRLHMDENSTYSGTFNLDETTTTGGQTYASAEQPFRNTVIVSSRSDQGSILFRGIVSGTQRVVPGWKTGWVKTIHNQESAVPSFLFYGQEEHHLVQAMTGHTLDLPSFSLEKGSYGNDYGYHEMYSDRFYPGFTYMVSGNKTLYRVDLKDFTRKQLHTFNKPVYGMSSSPDGTRIAVLTAHDDYIGPGADLLVLDEKGNTLLSRENAVYLSHSDGFLFVYPLTWEDDSILLLPADSGEDNPLGTIRYDIGSGTSSVMQDERITDQVTKDIWEHERWEKDYSLLSGLHWSPDGRSAAYTSGTGAIQVYDKQERSFEFVAAGTLLGWMPDGTLAWADVGGHAYTF
ncbi:PD40 domain-containing protein [Paenibacillus tritici]|uniref:PD40 domain-containing protein n=1 Tax=Paenibacillus tritici TaxID=1873425 RepID=UPI001BA831F9|nr:PD40 domain-containing protein [Paenibacillus tritici]QUL54343.1 PD40 domain-containing protein [Paenibacillus tritici]